MTRCTCLAAHPAASRSIATPRLSPKMSRCRGKMDPMSDQDPMIVAGEHAADRLLRAQKLEPGSPYLVGEEPPTPNQIGAVLHALADHTLLMHLVGDEVAALGEDRAHLGPGWQQATAIGRFLQKMGDRVEHATRVAHQR